MGFSMPSLSGSCSCFLMLLWAILLRALADLLGRPVGAVGQDIADAFPPDDPVEQPEEPALVVGRHARRSPRRSGCRLRSSSRAKAMTCGVENPSTPYSVARCAILKPKSRSDIGRHGVGELREALHHVGGMPRDGNGRPALHRAVVAADQARAHRSPCVSVHFSATSLVQKSLRRVRALPHMKFSVCHFSSCDCHLLRRPEPGQDGHDPRDRIVVRGT